MLKKPYKCEQGFVFVMKITDKIDIRLKMLDVSIMKIVATVFKL
ncbi:hypothetical protein M949_1526 [Riemerella anatipestifer CH3]|nr:hypothetical protein M949_0773 [Riemerella anatipestifer CH3]AIH02467.1 hypothetical protein M949_1299 [Riemerella anatipestifer CH3]AIH02693.1 hypothetical protein M949_1526 [Riemerella anatipestifer CH3]